MPLSIHERIKSGSKAGSTASRSPAATSGEGIAAYSLCKRQAPRRPTQSCRAASPSMSSPIKRKKAVAQPGLYAAELWVAKLYSCSSPLAAKLRRLAAAPPNPALRAGAYTVRLSIACTGRFHRRPHASRSERAARSGLEKPGSVVPPPSSASNVPTSRQAEAQRYRTHKCSSLERSQAAQSGSAREATGRRGSAAESTRLSRPPKLQILSAKRAARCASSPSPRRWSLPWRRAGSGSERNHCSQVGRSASAPVGWQHSAKASALKKVAKPCVEARNPTIHGARHARTYTSTAVAATQPVATPAKRPALRPWRIDTRRSSSATGASMQAARPRWVASA
mmetsp:Transcript_31331/g.104693  ORF Transcript_31331/g.104693 Transcript_31331/m.104693 type:complete len:338 (-) Transcript_31331:1121-2134(-)